MLSQRHVRAFQMKRQHLAPQTRGRSKFDIPTILQDVGGLYWVEPIYHRMETWNRAWFDQLRWQEKKIIEGRFFGGTLQYVPADEVPVYYQALTPKLELSLNDKLLLNYIEEHGPISKNEIIAGVSLSKKAVEESIYRLDLAFKIVRAGWVKTRTWGQPLWDTFEKWSGSVIDLDAIEPLRAKEELILKFLKTNGVLSLSQLTSLFKGSFKPGELREILEGLEERGLVISGNFVEDIFDRQYATPDGLSSLSSESGKFDEEFVCILSDSDPFVRIWNRELFELFGMKGPSARGPAWLSYIFLNETPVGIVDYKWRVNLSQINNIRLFPDCYDEGFFAMIFEGLEREAKLMGHKSIEIRNIDDAPAQYYFKSSVGEILQERGYFLEQGRLVKSLSTR